MDLNEKQPQKPLDIMKNVEFLRQREEYIVELLNLTSKMMFIRYKKLIECGFTEFQSLEIIKARGYIE